uniref:Protein HIDE1 isoform X2 n=1 Tax=Geotrypetes seraphini TaxID=260995 RepID=A0A6P8PAP5_GEOSA|nr:protein HIDE1 isoform X2 [Geotrypetes seraphini]
MELKLGGGGDLIPRITLHRWCKQRLYLTFKHTQTTNYSALPPMSVPPPDHAWLVPVSVGSTTGLLLLLSLVIVVLAIRRVKASRRQKKREKESCWTQNTNLTFDNVVFADPTSQKPSSDPQASSGPLSVSSLQFSTFRS